MKIKLMTTLLMVMVIQLLSCTKSNENQLVIKQSKDLLGKWASENKDTLNFMDSTFVIHKSYSPLKETFYIYKIISDSIYLWPAHSSNLYNSKGYYFNLQAEFILIRKFSNIDSSYFKRIK